MIRGAFGLDKSRRTHAFRQGLNDAESSGADAGRQRVLAGDAEIAPEPTARSVGARSASLDAGRSMGNPALATTQLLIRSPRRRWRAAGR